MDLIVAWGSAMTYEGLSPVTVSCRSRLLRQLAKHTDPGTATRTDLIAFLSTKPSASSRATAQSYLRVFYAWCAREGHRADDPTLTLPKVRAPQGNPRPAHADVVRALLAVADQRTRVMALLMVYCGLRSCEVAGVRHDHLRLEGLRWWLDIPRAKGGKAQSVAIPDERIVDELLACPEWDVSAQTVQKSVKAALVATGDRRTTPHQLRHYYGTQALAATPNLRIVQQMMRHASPATTARYTAIASSEVSDASAALPWIA